MATTDRDAYLAPFLKLPDFYTVFLGFYMVNVLCFRVERVNIQGVSTELRENLYTNFGGIRNFDTFLTRITLMYV